jgi:UDP-GlcNAc:undecaprenyl-phosphate GlcNAc-1-phosphate transferase
MRTYVLAFVVAMALSAAFTPIARRAAIGMGAVSSPGGRHINARSVPRLGGIALAVACVGTLLGLLGLESSVAGVMRHQAMQVVGLVVGALLMFGVGALDDTRGLRAITKLGAQVVAAVGAYYCGFRINAVHLPLVGDQSMGMFALPVTVVWIVGIINAINLIDGLDGLAAGVAFFAGVTNFVVGYLSQEILVATVMATLMGAVLGFLFFNFNPARIFMGDSGSYLLGFLLGTTALAGTSQKASTAVAILVPILALGVPIFDTLFSIARRLLERRSIFSPDRGHIHHRLLDLGLTHRRAVLILYSVSIVFTAAAIAVSAGRSWEVGVAILAASVVLLGLVRFVGYFEYLLQVSRQRTRLRGQDTETLRRLLPEALGRLESAPSEKDVLREIERLLRAGAFASAELRTIDENTVEKWTSDEIPNEGVVSAKFPIGEETRARSLIVFRWQSPDGQVSAGAEVLLQVIVDALGTSLERVNSKLSVTKVSVPVATRAEQVASEPLRAN